MTSRSAIVGLVLLLTGCGSPLGRVLVTIVFENETRTQCIKAFAKNAAGAQATSTPSAIPRAGKDTLLIGLGETKELVGEVKVTVSRFSSADCSGTAFASETKTTQIVHNGPTAQLEFRFGDPGDGGVDGGLDAGPGDAGVDAGCDVAACGNAPGECEVAPATGCQGDGGCRFGFRAAQTACTGGVCNSMGSCIANVCAVLPAGSSCDDGLMCTPTSTCSSGQCRGTCPAPPQCNLPVQPVMCDSVTPTACALRPTNDLAGCGPAGSFCLDGGCMPWIVFSPANFPSTLATVPYPTAPWTLASPDGGDCDTIISTSGPAATVTQGDCGSPTITSTVDDAGVSVITMTGLDVGATARLHFEGTRPVQLLVLGDANVRGLISVSPLLPGQLPAGTQPLSCSAVLPGAGNKQGGGGGAFGGSGGRGGEAGGQGGAATSAVIPLRGGCAGANGFRPAGVSAPGTGGGAIQLIVADTLTLSGVVTASGGGGAPGTADNEGAGGGGSGGMVIVEARIINLTGGAITANGGGGGEGGETGVTSDPGANGPMRLATAAPAADNAGSTGGIGGLGGDNSQVNGGNGGNSGGAKGGGGGGGSAGVVLVRANPCTKGTGVISGAQPTAFNCN